MNFKNINWRKIVSELILGSVVGTILGIFGLLAGMNYGGNYGCFTIIDKAFGLQGYESCGLFGLILGILIGSLVSVVLLDRSSFQKESYEKIAVISIISVIVIPLAIASAIGLPLDCQPRVPTTGGRSRVLNTSGMLALLGALAFR